MEKRKIKVPLGIWFALVTLIVCAALNVAARMSADFADWYRDNVFSAFQPAASWLSALVPFSLGEIMICLGILLMLAVPILLILKRVTDKKAIAGALSIILKIIPFILAYIMLTETLNCFMLYHCSSFASRYGISENQYTPEQLLQLSEDIIEKCNEAAEKVERDENGLFVMTSDRYEASAAAMNSMPEQFDGFDGYYPKPKAMVFSGIMSKFSLMGIYFPFSMESNYNNEMHTVELPATICHEYAHQKGWIQEDEANFISYIACVNYDNPEYVYSGYITAVDYLWSAVYRDCNLSDEEYAAFVESISEDVRRDLSYHHGVFRKAQSDTAGKTMAKISDTAIDVNLKINGVSDGKRSYGRFVDLLLNYYIDEDDLI